MTSPPALLFNTYYHIYNRGINRENIFFEERNYDYFLQLYEKYIVSVADTFAYCLLRNHFHLMVRIKSEEEIQEETLKVSETFRVSIDPSKKFSDFFNAYAKSINKAYGRTGSLFQHPFGRVIISKDSQFWNVIAYIHQNPQKHHFVDDFREWKFSSYRTILSEKPTLVNRDMVINWFGSLDNFLAVHSQWVTDAEIKRFAEEDL